ncbi:MAG TPA: cytochrome c1 [Caulobacteraceae bacterium]|jgi:ubiquinol-cytochrome c reductase cytochrome c1 subunit|nr:cytochrome c1 [Caulobacteraceae bacterium]
MLRKAFAIAAVLGIAATAQASFAATTAAEPKEMHWSFEGPFGRFDQEQLQRGYKVYHDVCSSCHAMHLMSYRNLGQVGGPFYDPKYPNPNDNPYVKSIVQDYKVPDIDSDTGDVIKRPATPADTFVSPFPNEAAARASNGGALPPDLSLIVKARDGGARYVYSILTGYQPAPAGLQVPPNRYYNPWMPGDLTSFWHGSGPTPIGGFIAMPFQLTPNRVTFDDGVKATTDQEAKDVVAFLAWAAEPHQTERKQLGFAVLIYLVIFTGLLYLSYRRIWRNVAH